MSRIIENLGEWLNSTSLEKKTIVVTKNEDFNVETRPNEVDNGI